MRSLAVRKDGFVHPWCILLQGYISICFIPNLTFLFLLVPTVDGRPGLPVLLLVLFFFSKCM